MKSEEDKRTLAAKWQEHNTSKKSSKVDAAKKRAECRHRLRLRGSLMRPETDEEKRLRELA